MDKLLNTKLFLLDMDGTLYLGDEVFDGAVDYINTIKASGRQYIYLTNNSSRAGIDYVTRLRKLGFPCEMENVFTSGMATAMYLNTKFPGCTVYPVGTRAFMGELESYGVKLGEDDVKVVCVGFDTELTYEKLDQGGALLAQWCSVYCRKPRLGLPDACKRSSARLRQHMRSAHGGKRRKAGIYRKTQPQYG